MGFGRLSVILYLLSLEHLIGRKIGRKEQVRSIPDSNGRRRGLQVVTERIPFVYLIVTAIDKCDW